jgi:hypothetical protein
MDALILVFVVGSMAANFAYCWIINDHIDDAERKMAELIEKYLK